MRTSSTALGDRGQQCGCLGATPLQWARVGSQPGSPPRFPFTQRRRARAWCAYAPTVDTTSQSVITREPALALAPSCHRATNKHLLCSRSTTPRWARIIARLHRTYRIVSQLVSCKPWTAIRSWRSYCCCSIVMMFIHDSTNDPGSRAGSLTSSGYANCHGHCSNIDKYVSFYICMYIYVVLCCSWFGILRWVM